MLIGLNGFKEVGKDEAARYLVKYHGFTRLAFADKLKESVARLFDLTPDLVDKYKEKKLGVVVEVYDADDASGPDDNSVSIQCFTWRHFLQRYGTEAHRDVFGKNFWVHALLDDNDLTGNVVVTDVRFENEIAAIKANRGFIVRIERPGFDGEEHASEQMPDEAYVDYVINNNGPLDIFYGQVEGAYSYLARFP